MTSLLIFLLLVVFVEALTEILVTSFILEKPRMFISRRNGFLGTLVHCGYCTSVWVSTMVAWIIPFYIWSMTGQFWLDYIITALILHRLSNLFHELTSKLFGRRPMVFVVHKKETVVINE